MSKNETGYWIKTKGNAKNALTEPENVVRGILKDLGYGYRIQEKITVNTIEEKDPFEGTTVGLASDEVSSISWNGLRYPDSNVDGFGRSSTSIVLTIDLFIPEHRICVEVDGEYHRTARQERKTAWRDAQLIANGYRVLHIDAAYTETKELQEQLKPLIQKAIKELIAGEQTRRIVA